MNPMREISVEKITLNIGAGKDQARLEKSIKLLKNISGIPPVKTFAKKRIPNWGLRPGLPIGCKLTLRKQKALLLLPRLLDALDNNLKKGQFDEKGNVSFGIPEYIDIKDVKYDPTIGVIGLQVCVTLQRKGFRVKHRKIMQRKIPKKHQISKEESVEYMKKNFKVNIEVE